MDVTEFASRINEGIDEIAESDPTAEPHDVVQCALGNVLLNGKIVDEGGDQEEHQLDVYNGDNQGVVVYSGGSLICHIDRPSLIRLTAESGIETESSGAECLKQYLSQSVNDVRNSPSQSDTQSSIGASVGSVGSDSGYNINSRKKVCRDDRKVKYPRYRTRFEGELWVNEGDKQCDQDKHLFLMKAKTTNTKVASGVSSLEERPDSTPLPVVSKDGCRLTSLQSNDSLSLNASDVVSLTSICSACSNL